MKMASPQQRTSVKHAPRADAGIWLRGIRDDAGVSQKELARILGFEYYTFISQLENGRGRIPANKYREYAEALGVDGKVFAKSLLKFYEPFIYSMLFEDEPRSRPMPTAVRPAKTPVVASPAEGQSDMLSFE